MLSQGSLADPAHIGRLRAYVGPNAEYYLGKWAALDRGSSISLNFAALFLSCFWLAYRKMTGPALGIAAIYFGASLLEQLGRVEKATWISVPISIAVGLFGNKFYRSHAERAVAMNGGDPARLHLAGGVSVKYGVGLAVAYFASVGGAIWYMVENRIGPFAQTTSYRPYSPGGSGTSPIPGATPTSRASTVAESWLVGTWGLGGCVQWLRFNANRTLSDNSGATGTWSLSTTGELRMTSPSGTRSGQVSRQGETLILTSSSGRQELRRCP